MPAAATQPTGKRSRRGRLSEGAPTLRTPQTVAKIVEAISLGLNDQEVCDLVGINNDTLSLWKRDPEFFGTIKSAVLARMVLRLKKIETGADGWQGAAWLTERLLPQRYSKPEVQISLQTTVNQTPDALTITISAEEACEIEEKAEPVRQKVRKLLAGYRMRGIG
jgi:hypothetical protein